MARLLRRFFPSLHARTGAASFGLLTVVVSVIAASAAIVAPGAFLPQAVVAPMRDPMLAGAVYGGMGIVILFFGKLGIDLKAAVERLAIRVDDPKNGLVVELQRHVTETRAVMGALGNEIEDVKQEVASVHATCVATHQRANGGG